MTCWSEGTRKSETRQSEPAYVIDTSILAWHYHPAPALPTNKIPIHQLHHTYSVGRLGLGFVLLPGAHAFNIPFSLLVIITFN